MVQGGEWALEDGHVYLLLLVLEEVMLGVMGHLGVVMVLVALHRLHRGVVLGRKGRNGVLVVEMRRQVRVRRQTEWHSHALSATALMHS